MLVELSEDWSDRVNLEFTGGLPVAEVKSCADSLCHTQPEVPVVEVVGQRAHVGAED